MSPWVVRILIGGLTTFVTVATFSKVRRLDDDLDDDLDDLDEDLDDDLDDE